MRVSLVNHELPQGRGILDLYNPIIFPQNGLGKNRFYRVIGPQNRYCANGRGAGSFSPLSFALRGGFVRFSLNDALQVLCIDTTMKNDQTTPGIPGVPISHSQLQVERRENRSELRFDSVYTKYSHLESL